MAEGSIKSRAIGSLFWMFFERSGRAFAELLVQVLMARLLVPNDFGALAILLVFVSLGNVVVQSGLNSALIQNFNTNEEDYSTVFWLSLGISVVLCMLIFSLAPTIAEFYSMDYLVWPLRVISSILIINSFNAVQIAIVQRSLKFKKIFYATLFSIVVSGAVGITAALLDMGLWALVAQQLVYQLMNCSVLFVQIKWVPRFVFNARRAKILFAFGWKLLVSGLLNQGYQSLSDLIIGKQFSTLSLGLVTQGKKYPQAIGSLLDGTIRPVMFSVVSHVQSDAAHVKRLVRRALKTSTYLVVPCMTLFAVVAEPTVRLLLGEQWLSCVPFLQMYCFIYALLPIHTANLQALNGIGRSDLFLKLELIKKTYGIVLLLTGAFIFKDVFIIIGSYMLADAIGTFVNAWPSRRAFDYSYAEQIRDVCPAFLLAAASAALAIPAGLLELPDVACVAIQAAIMAAAYLGLSKLLHVEALEYLLATARELGVGRKHRAEG